MILSAGTLLYRRGDKGIEVLLVHPSGDYNADSPWSIPKGWLNDEEDFEDAARRETREETGVECPEKLVPMGEVVYPNGHKKVICFAGEGSNQEPTCASWEVDRAEYLPIADAEKVINLFHLDFIKRLKEYLGLANAKT